LTTRQAADREKLFQASIANAVQQMMLAAASMKLGTVWVSVREEVEPELREMFQVPPELRLLWVVPIGHARAWPKAKPRRSSAAFTHWETYDSKKLRRDADIHAWPKN
jgi:nitroreductase